MRADHDPVTEFDLSAYVDDQLEPARRISVEAWLAERPAEAARVMADLRNRDELRLALGALPLPRSIETNALALRLQKSLARRRTLARLSRAAVLALMLGAGWVAHAEFNALGVRESVASPPPPAFLADAMRAHGTSVLRASMVSQIETADYDPAEILAATALRVPALPTEWGVTDVQIFPSTFGPSLEMSLRSPELGTVSLFAVRPGSFDAAPVALFVDGSSTAAHWQLGEIAYALVSVGGSREAVEHAANQIADGLR